MENRRIVVFQQKYDSIQELASDYDIDYQRLLRVIKKGVSPEDAVSMLHGKKEEPPAQNVFCVDGVEYSSLAAACRRLGISAGSVYARRKGLIQEGLSEQEATSEALKQAAAAGHRKREVAVAGMTFPSRNAAMAHFGISAATVNARIARARESGQELSFEDAVLLGRSKRYAAAEYSAAPADISSRQEELLVYLQGALQRECHFQCVKTQGHLSAIRRLEDDPGEIRLEITWASSHILSIRSRWMNGTLAQANDFNSKYVGIKLCLLADGSVTVVCDTFLMDASLSAKYAAAAAARQFVETYCLILAQLSASETGFGRNSL